MTDRTLPHCLFFDFDGTLSVRGAVSKANVEALRRVQAAGHKIFLNTGRSRANIPDRAFEGIAWDGIVAGYSYAEVGGTVVLEDHLPKEALLQIKPFCDKYGFTSIIQGVKVTYIYDRVTPEPFGDDLNSYIEEHYNKMRITNLDIREMSEWTGDDEFTGCWHICHSGYTEIIRCGFDKSSGIRAIAAYLGIPLERTVSFGDSNNDVDMLRCTGTSIIMHTSPAELSEIASFRTESDENGVAEGIARLFFD